MYGMVESALLWYEEYLNVLKYVGFKLNPYGMYLANKDINGKQYTTAWYVKDNKVSNVKQDLIGDFINKVEGRFPVLTVMKGNAHTLLGINIRYLNNKRVAINIKEYISEAVQDFGWGVS